MNKREIGQRIREKRLERSWSQEELAERMDLSVTYIGMIERGEKLPRLETFIKMVNILGTSTDELLMDVVHQGYNLRMFRYAEQISKLEKKREATAL